MTKPPRWQIIVWSTVNMLPQTHTDGLSGIGLSYRSLTKFPLVEINKPLRGIIVSQLDAPFSQARSTGSLCLVWQHGLHLLKPIILFLPGGVYQSLYLGFFWGLMGLLLYFAYKWSSYPNRRWILRIRTIRLIYESKTSHTYRQYY